MLFANDFDMLCGTLLLVLYVWLKIDEIVQLKEWLINGELVGSYTSTLLIECVFSVEHRHIYYIQQLYFIKLLRCRHVSVLFDVHVSTVHTIYLIAENVYIYFFFFLKKLN